MKLKLNNRDAQVQKMLDWIMFNKLFHSISTRTEDIVHGYATYLTKKKCLLKHGKVDKSCGYFKRQLDKQKVFSIMTLNILCTLHSIPNSIGYIYIVSNPAYPNWYKVGAAKDAETRLLSYQTGTPFRDYKLEWYKPVCNYAQLEKEFHNNSDFSHEWVNIPLVTLKQMLGSSTRG